MDGDHPQPSGRCRFRAPFQRSFWGLIEWIGGDETISHFGGVWHLILGLPAGFAADGFEDVIELVIGGEFFGPPVEHVFLLVAETGFPLADFLADGGGLRLEDIERGGIGQAIPQPGADEHGLLRLVEDCDVESKVVVSDRTQARQVH